MKPRVLVTQKLFPEVLTFLETETEAEVLSREGVPAKPDIIRRIADKEGLLCLLTDKIDAEVMDAAPCLKVIANTAVGYDNIDIGHARHRGIMVTNTPEILTEATADLTWALILAVARRIPQSDRFIRRGEFEGWALDLCLGRDVSGKRLGIIGMGRIGRAVALRARAFRMETVYFDPHPLSPGEESAHAAAFLPLDELLSSSDIVTVHASLTPDSHHLISGEKLALMKKAAIFINVSRGPVVDEAALAETLEQKRIWGAGLDVYEREPEVEPRLLRLENVVLLPHIGSATFETRLNMAMTAARNLVQGVQGRRPDNLIY
jgi:glyoxylate reductase